MEQEVKKWRVLLEAMAGTNGATFTAADVASETRMARSAVSQILQRLRRWGHLRVIGFEPPKGGIGRRLYVYEVTDHGKRAAAWGSSHRKESKR
jgi:predicted transcriptional regulator